MIATNRIKSDRAAVRRAEMTHPANGFNRHMPPQLGNALLTATRAALEGNETVLLLADTPVLRGTLARILRRYGYQVLPASSHAEAQHLAKAGRQVHLLLMDLSQPEPGDLQLALWFRATYPGTHVLMTSSSLWDLDFHLNVGQQIARLQKPFTSFELARMMRRILA